MWAIVIAGHLKKYLWYLTKFCLSTIYCAWFVWLAGPLKQFANVVLFLLMCCSAYSHYAIKDGLDKMTPECIFGLLLACRFIVRLQIQSRESRSEQAASHYSSYANGQSTSAENSEEVDKKTQWSWRFGYLAWVAGFCRQYNLFLMNYYGIKQVRQFYCIDIAGVLLSRASCSNLAAVICRVFY